MPLGPDMPHSRNGVQAHTRAAGGHASRCSNGPVMKACEGCGRARGLVLPGQLAEALAFGHLPESRLLLRNVSSGLTNDWRPAGRTPLIPFKIIRAICRECCVR